MPSIHLPNIVPPKETMQRKAINLDQQEIKTAIQDIEKEFTKTTDHICEEQKDLKSLISKKDETMSRLEQENCTLQSEINGLKSRLYNMENISRSRNIELQSVPESQSENVLQLFKRLCSIIGVKMDDTNILACRRVAKMNAKSNRPRNILVTLSSQNLRDLVLSSTTRFNKSQSKDHTQMLNSSHLGISGEKTRIYITEHLSPECKHLYSETRRVAKEKEYKYVWVKFGKIYVRKNDECEAIQIKNVERLREI
ncbi:uncharacterized protein LOC142985735 [Anticarsia gemmatalis]|uniref:uncharacterized protein LOC142985735 n=1 Tax=Anticarsia gemmatalis TaxID=129554 RepID=UPI003F775564